MTEQWRPEQLPEERLARWARDTFPGGLEGHSPNPVPSFPTFHDQSASIRGVTPAGGTGVAFNEELLKQPGDSPDGTYQLEFKPMPRSLHCHAGGIPQTFDEDFNFDGNVLTIHPGMDLHVNEQLWVRYAYLIGSAIEPADADYENPTLVGIPWGYLNGGSGTRSVFFRLEGVDKVPAGYLTNVMVGFGQSFGGPGTYDYIPGGYAYHPSGYASNIYQQDITRPYTEPGEAPFTDIKVLVGEWYTSVYVEATNSPATIYYDGDAGSPPPTSYQG